MGQTPVLPPYFEGDYPEGYTMISAATIDGFLKDYRETVDTEQFEYCTPKYEVRKVRTIRSYHTYRTYLKSRSIMPKV